MSSVTVQIGPGVRAGCATRMRLLGAAACALLLLAASPPSWAQWPTKTLRIVVNGPPGGAIDAVTRLVAAQLSERLGSTVVVDNKSGGSGLIGAQEVLRSAADGGTFLASLDGVLTEVPHTVKINFDPLKDITPVVDLFGNGWVLVANEGVTVKSLAELAIWAKQQPAGINYGSFSAGTISHILGLQMANSMGLQMNHVPFRGGADAMQALMGGHVPLLFSGVAQALPHIKAGKVHAIAFTGEQRSPFLPDVPTFKELGHPELAALSWIGLWARSGVPRELQERMHKEVAQILAQPGVRDKIKALGTNPALPRSADELIRQMAVDYPRAGRLLNAAGLKPQ